jgi:hypothetical protein
MPGMGGRMGFTVPAEPLILPHNPVNANFLLTCLFSLDILVRMCACLALKKFTKFRTHWGQKNLLSSHKKSPQKIVVRPLKNRPSNFKDPKNHSPIVHRNRKKIMGSRTKKIIKPHPWWSLPIQWNREQKAMDVHIITFNIMVLLSHSLANMSSIILIFLIPPKTGQWWYTTRPKKSSKKNTTKKLN